MAFHLTVAGSLEPLADVLAELLAHPVPGSDPFQTELVVVPGEGVKAWVRARLAHRLGATGAGSEAGSPNGTANVRGNGIVANIEYPFPATVVRRALGDDLTLGDWSTGRLTWPVHEVLVERGETFGQRNDLLRARAIADLFDRYTLHRQRMVVQWSKGNDVDATGGALEAHALWQPALWRAVQQHLSPEPTNPVPTDAQRMVERTDQLRAGTHLVSELSLLPSRVVLFGLASLPSSHLEVLTALSTQIDVHVFAPAASAQRWIHVRDALISPLPLPLPRGDSQMPTGVGHPIVTNWGRASRESHALLLDAASHLPSFIDPPAPEPGPTASMSLLEQVQHSIRADLVPGNPAERFVVDQTDSSIRLHRAHGPARQVEILRDQLLHLFTETNADGSPRFMPRDVVVLCGDVAAFAPLIEATFAGDPDRGVPQIPVRIADRTIRQQNPLLECAGMLLDLLEGRFRASQVLEFASRQPVRQRFGLDIGAIARIEQWTRETNIRWGLDAIDQSRFGLPAQLTTHTWQDGLDQLLVGSVMSDQGPRLAALGVAPYADLEGGDVEVAGAIADLVHELQRVTALLRTDATVHEWCDALLQGLRSLCDTIADDAWQWRDVEFAIGGFRDEATIDGVARTATLAAEELVSLLRIRLDSGGGRPRFGSGSVTVSSLTAQRGVPHAVVCLVGIDDDLGSGAVAASEDLIAATACIGDRDARSEQRAQLLDAVLSAGQRLMVFSTGRDVRTNQALAPAVAVAELIDALDVTAQAPDGGQITKLLIIDHPRQAWSDAAFIPGELGIASAWSFDQGALEAANARRADTERAPFLSEPLPPPTVSGTEPNIVSLDALRGAVTQPARVLLRDRLGISIRETQDAIDDQIPLDLGGLAEWEVADALLSARLRSAAASLGSVVSQASDADLTWEHYERARGAVPPGTFGDAAITRVRSRVNAVLSAMQTELGTEPFAPRTIAVRLDVADTFDTIIEGNVQGLCGNTIVTVSTSRLKASSILVAVIELAALALNDPEIVHEALIIGRAAGNGDDAAWYRVSLLDPTCAAEVLEIFVDLHRRALRDAIPAFATTTRALFVGDDKGAASAWRSYGGWGEATDRWTSAIPEFQCDFRDLQQLASRDDERGTNGEFTTRLAYWTDRLWATVATFAEVVESGGAAEESQESQGSDGSAPEDGAS